MPARADGGARPSGVVRAVSPYLFYGWVVVAMGFIAQVLTSLSSQGLSTYVGPLQREFGWSAATTAAGRSFQQADSVLGPLNGWLVDRFGPRVLMSIGVVLFAVAFVAFGAVGSLWAYYGACLLMGLANSFVGLLVVSSSLNRWFRRRRTTAIGVAVVGFAVAGMIFIPLAVWSQEEYGWRATAMGTGVAVLLIGLPIALFMRDGPEPYGLLPDGERPAPADRARAAAARGGGLVNFTLGQALRTRAFWLMTAGTSVAMFVQSAVTVHQFPYLEEILTRETAAWVLSIMNAFNIGGRLAGGVLGDRLPKHRLLGLNLIATMLGLVFVALATTLLPLLVYAALFGFAWGVRAAVTNSLQGDYFGRAAFGRIAGLTQTLVAPTAMVAPIVVGAVADVSGGYQVPFLALAGLAAVGSLLYFLAARPPDPAPRRA